MKKNDEKDAVGTEMPDELGETRKLVEQFMSELQMVDNEIATLRDDRKELIESYKKRIDYKTLALAMKVVKIEDSVVHKDAYDAFIEVLRNPKC